MLSAWWWLGAGVVWFRVAYKLHGGFQPQTALPASSSVSLYEPWCRAPHQPPSIGIPTGEGKRAVAPSTSAPLTCPELMGSPGRGQMSPQACLPPCVCSLPDGHSLYLPHRGVCPLPGPSHHLLSVHHRGKGPQPQACPHWPPWGSHGECQRGGGAAIQGGRGEDLPLCAEDLV